MIWTPDGRCPCGGEFADRWVDVRLAAEEPPDADRSLPALELDGVAQGVCSSCGSRVYHVSVLNRIEQALKGWR